MAKTNFGLDVGNTDTKELIFLFKYSPSALFSAVPVLPPISYPFTFASDAVPSFV